MIKPRQIPMPRVEKNIHGREGAVVQSPRSSVVEKKSYKKEMFKCIPKSSLKTPRKSKK
jgi:hypothetical protein